MSDPEYAGFRLVLSTGEVVVDPPVLVCLNEAMRRIGAVEKASQNRDQGYKFRGVDDVVAACHPVFVDCGIVMVPRVRAVRQSTWTNQKGTLVTDVSLDVSFIFYGPTRDRIVASVVGEARDYADKATNKAMSAALKYALVQVLCIPTYNLLDEADEAHPETAPATPSDEAVSRPVEAPDPAIMDLIKVNIAELDEIRKAELMAWWAEAQLPKLGDLDAQQATLVWTVVQGYWEDTQAAANALAEAQAFELKHVDDLDGGS